MRHISKSFTLLIRFLAQKWKKFDFKKKITVWNTAKETCPIRTESGKGAFVIFFSLNERAVAGGRAENEEELLILFLIAFPAVFCRYLHSPMQVPALVIEGTFVGTCRYLHDFDWFYFTDYLLVYCFTSLTLQCLPKTLYNVVQMLLNQYTGAKIVIFSAPAKIHEKHCGGSLAAGGAKPPLSFSMYMNRLPHPSRW